MATSLMQLLFQIVVEEMLFLEVIQYYTLSLCNMVISENVPFDEFVGACG